jgi:hypothetical protein
MLSLQKGHPDCHAIPGRDSPGDTFASTGRLSGNRRTGITP